MIQVGRTKVDERLNDEILISNAAILPNAILTAGVLLCRFNFSKLVF
jgi:hypothetical protein